jgi:hypothetical protein
VIVSTCDKQLYKLMLRKFGPLETLGLRITGITITGGDGGDPVVKYDLGGPSARGYLASVG